MTMKHFRRLTFLLSFIFILTVGGVAAMAANNGPCEDEEWSFAYVQFYNLEKFKDFRQNKFPIKKKV